LVFNIELSIKDAIEAMIKEEIYCGLIWDTELNKFNGIFTIRDFLNLIKVLYQKINTHIKDNGSKCFNAKSLVSYLFQRNNINLDALDVIMENVEIGHKMNGDSKSEKSNSECNFVDDMIIDDENNTIERCLKNYKEFFKIFEHININDYFSDILPVSKFLFYITG
jgi:hypothetical protein